jgi:hypothetical protein
LELVIKFPTFSTVSTVCVTGAGAGVDSAWEREKLEARKMLVNRAESPASSARCVGLPFSFTEGTLFVKLFQAGITK